MTLALNPGTTLGAVLFGIIIAVSGISPASAQAGNQPYQSRIGISYGARQAILNARLLDSRPRNLVRGPDGALLDVTRRNNLPFLSYPGEATFLPGARPSRGWATGLGTGLGWGGNANAGGVSYPYSGGTGAGSIMLWISLLDTFDTHLYAPPVSGRPTPIDSWIGQNDLG